MGKVALYIDFAFCIIFLPAMLFAFPVERWWGSYPVYFASFALWLYVSYFAYRYFIVPRLFGNRRNRVYAIMAIVATLAITLLFSCYEITSPYYEFRQLHLELNPLPHWGMRQNRQAVWLHFILVVTFCLVVGMSAEAYRQRLAREELEFERNKAELALFKAQINPHFLFNTLNTIYGLLITNSALTVTALERFIDLTKYIYNNARKDFISLGEEIGYISQYIELQRLRLNECASIKFTHRVDDDSSMLPPMLLITFVENAFKYGISSNEPCFVDIHIEQHDDSIHFSVENSIICTSKGSSRQSGIDNCRKRLSLLYPDRHTLEIVTTESGSFLVNLTLKGGKL